MKKKWLLAAGAVLLAVLCLGCGKNPESVFTLSKPGQASPMGPRRIMIYEGCRYAFLDNGGVYSLEGEPGKALGTLTLDILENPRENGEQDFACTFGLGGTVYEIPGVHPGFRVAVALEGSWYLCENVDILGETPVDLPAYLKAAGFPETVRSGEIRDHMGLAAVKELSCEEAAALTALLSRCTPAGALSDAEYQQIGKAQREGKSWLMGLRLSSGPDFRFYLIPELSLAMIGDNKYRLPEDFGEAFGGTFAGLTQGPLPAM